MDIKMYVDKGSVHTWGQHLGASELCIRRKGWGMEGRWDFGTGVKHPGAGASLIRGQSHRDQKYKSAPVDDGHVVHVVGLVWQHTYTTAFEYNCDQETCMTYLRFLIEHTMHTYCRLWLVVVGRASWAGDAISCDPWQYYAAGSIQFSVFTSSSRRVSRIHNHTWWASRV